LWIARIARKPVDPFDSAASLVAAIVRREISSHEWLETYQRRIEQHNPALNAVVTLDAERALDEADAADRAIAPGEATGAMHGPPVTITDSLATAGLRTTAGAPPFRGLHAYMQRATQR